MGFFSKLFKGPEIDMEKSDANAKKMRALFHQAVGGGEDYRLIFGYTEDVSRFNYGFEFFNRACNICSLYVVPEGTFPRSVGTLHDNPAPTIGTKLSLLKNATISLRISDGFKIRISYSIVSPQIVNNPSNSKIISKPKISYNSFVITDSKKHCHLGQEAAFSYIHIRKE